MITIEKVEQLYEKVLESKTVKTKELNELGFNSADIKKLIEQGKIVRTERGLYEFVDLVNLVNFGDKFTTQKEYIKANEVYITCYQHGLFSHKLFLKLMNLCIRLEDYEGFFRYYQELINSETQFHSSDNNFLLLLMSYITEIDSDLQPKLEAIKSNKDSLLLSEKDERYNKVKRKVHNKIRMLCFNGQLEETLKLIDEEKYNLGVAPSIKLIKIMLEKIIVLRNKNKEENEIVYNGDNLFKYQIEDINEILVLILIQNEDMATVFSNFNLTENQINIVKLAIARYYFSNEEFEKGNKIYREVEHSKNKSEVVKRMMKEIMASRKFYQFREDPVGAVLKRRLETDSK